jgi:surfeit locus 1 family protein
MNPVRSRRWIVLTLLTVVAVATMVELGLWQLRRLHAVRADNARVRAQLALPVADAATLFAPGFSPSAVTFRRVTIEGRYDRVSEILVGNRSLNGEPGSHVLTPLRMADGRAMLVDRGWVPPDLSGEAEEATRPPVLVAVKVVGVLFPGEKKGTFGPSIPASGRVTTIPRIDVARVAKQLDYPVLPLYLRLEAQTPPQTGELPKAPGLPDLSDGPHLSYAVQWFLFATVAASVYAALLRRDLKKSRVPTQ